LWASQLSRQYARLGYPLEDTRTSLFLFESALQLVFAYPARRIRAAPLANVWVHLAVWLGVAMQAFTLSLRRYGRCWASCRSAGPYSRRSCWPRC
jgi:hypothetical protein